LATPQQTVAATPPTEGTENNGNPALRTELSNLRLTLGRNMQLNLPPILNFTAGGNLVVNGPFDNLRPEGTIELRRGRVNLFTSEFRLVGGYPHTAQFSRDRGLDPLLNLRLATSVEESTGRRLPTNENLSEIREQPLSAFGTVQTVRVEARVTGYASELSDRLELTSSPRRTQPEIIALLGGNLIDSFSQGNATVGLANLASSALLSNFQNQVSDALGLATFRLFPTTISERSQANSTLGLGAEVGIDITPSLSVSALRVLTANQPFQYSLRYRVNENILLRGSSNLSGDNRFLIEYETRF
jgi:translocation and assembly module TamB